MSGAFAEILLGILAVMVVAAAVSDLRTRTISNWLNAAIALLAIPYWWASGLPFWPDVAIQIGLGAALLALFAIAFAMGWIGGGDVKMIAALGLWFPLADTLLLLVVMALAGGVLTAAMLLRHWLTKSAAKLEPPYGVAIAVGAMWLIVPMIGERFLNQFA